MTASTAGSLLQMPWIPFSGPLLQGKGIFNTLLINLDLRLTCSRRFLRQTRAAQLSNRAANWAMQLDDITDSYLEWSASAAEYDRPPVFELGSNEPNAVINVYGWHCKLI